MTTPTGGGVPASPSDAWYPPPGDYWVAPPDEEQRPSRYGDLFNAPAQAKSGQPLVNAQGDPWHAVMVLSPSCEVISKARDDAAIEVARVIPLAAQAPKAVAAVIAGWQEKDGRTTVAFAHTVFLAGVSHNADHAEPMYADLKQTVRVATSDLREAGRVAALDHDARVAVIRREIYYRYRWLVSMEDVRANEAIRISHDPYFTEPRPPWGSPADE